MKLAVFDLDGTLTQHVGCDERCFLQAFADAFTIAALDRHWMDYEHVTDLWVVTQVFKTKYGRPPEDGEIRRYIDRYVSLLKEESKVTPDFVKQILGAQNFLSDLSTTEWRCAIATGGWENAARFKMIAAGLTIGHLPLAFAEDGPTRDDIVRSAIGRACADQKAERIVLVGDAVWDVRTARSLNLPFLGVGSGQDAKKLAAQGATHIVGDFLNIKHVISCLEEAAVPISHTQ